MKLTKAQRATLTWLDNPGAGIFRLHGRVWNNLLAAGLVHQVRGQLCITPAGRAALRNAKEG